jgi:hypothetical protein
MNIKPLVSELCRLVAQSPFAPVISPVTRVLLSPLADSFHFLRPSPVVLILRLRSPARLTPGFARLLAHGFGAEPLPFLRSWVRRKPPLAAEALLSTLYCHRASWPASNHSPGKPGTFLLGMPSECSSRGSGATPPGFNPNKKAQIARNPIFSVVLTGRSFTTTHDPAFLPRIDTRTVFCISWCLLRTGMSVLRSIDVKKRRLGQWPPESPQPNYEQEGGPWFSPPPHPARCRRRTRNAANPRMNHAIATLRTASRKSRIPNPKPQKNPKFQPSSSPRLRLQPVPPR